MSSSVKSTLLIVLAVLCALSSLMVSAMRKANHAVMADGKIIDIHTLSPENLEHRVRRELPLGSPLATVDGYLRKQGIEFSYQASTRTVYAIARQLKGSTVISNQSLALRFYFDDALELKLIDAKVGYTGL